MLPFLRQSYFRYILAPDAVGVEMQFHTRIGMVQMYKYYKLQILYSPTIVTIDSQLDYPIKTQLAFLTRITVRIWCKILHVGLQIVQTLIAMKRSS